MEAIKHIIGATEADSLNEVKKEIAAAQAAVRALEEAKLAELSEAIQAERSKIGYSPQGDANVRRAIRDNPQA